jgi:hypothetical protein
MIALQAGEGIGASVALAIRKASRVTRCFLSSTAGSFAALTHKAIRVTNSFITSTAGCSGLLTAHWFGEHAVEFAQRGGRKQTAGQARQAESKRATVLLPAVFRVQ